MELKDYRDRLDQIDDQLAELFRQRMETVKEVAEYKKNTKTPVLAAGREREILYRDLNNNRCSCCVNVTNINQKLYRKII